MIAIPVPARSSAADPLDRMAVAIHDERACGLRDGAWLQVVRLDLEFCRVRRRDDPNYRWGKP
jgi:hypothetical protein